MAEQFWQCTTCNTIIKTDGEKWLKTEDDVLHITCKCGKDFYIGSEDVGEEFFKHYVVQANLGKHISTNLQQMNLSSYLPFMVYDEIIKNAQLNRWPKFKELIKKYQSKITNKKIIDFLILNEML